LVLSPIAGAALAFADRPIGRWVGPAILIIEYRLSLAVMALTDHADRGFTAMICLDEPLPVLAFVTIFLTGRAGLWFVYVAKRWKAGTRNVEGRSEVRWSDDRDRDSGTASGDRGDTGPMGTTGCYPPERLIVVDDPGFALNGHPGPAVISSSPHRASRA
jgi:hypothetical protein